MILFYYNLQVVLTSAVAAPAVASLVLRLCAVVRDALDAPGAMPGQGSPLVPGPEDAWHVPSGHEPNAALPRVWADGPVASAAGGDAWAAGHDTWSRDTRSPAEAWQGQQGQGPGRGEGIEVLRVAGSAAAAAVSLWAAVGSLGPEPGCRGRRGCSAEEEVDPSGSGGGSTGARACGQEHLSWEGEGAQQCTEQGVGLALGQSGKHMEMAGAAGAAAGGRRDGCGCGSGGGGGGCAGGDSRASAADEAGSVGAVLGDALKQLLQAAAAAAAASSAGPSAAAHAPAGTHTSSSRFHQQHDQQQQEQQHHVPLLQALLGPVLAALLAPAAPVRTDGAGPQRGPAPSILQHLLGEQDQQHRPDQQYQQYRPPDGLEPSPVAANAPAAAAAAAAAATGSVSRLGAEAAQRNHGSAPGAPPLPTPPLLAPLRPLLLQAVCGTISSLLPQAHQVTSVSPGPGGPWPDADTDTAQAPPLGSWGRPTRPGAVGASAGSAMGEGGPYWVWTSPPPAAPGVWGSSAASAGLLPQPPRGGLALEDLGADERRLLLQCLAVWRQLIHSAVPGGQDQMLVDGVRAESGLTVDGLALGVWHGEAAAGAGVEHQEERKRGAGMREGACMPGMDAVVSDGEGEGQGGGVAEVQEAVQLLAVEAVVPVLEAAVGDGSGGVRCRDESGGSLPGSTGRPEPGAAADAWGSQRGQEEVDAGHVWGPSGVWGPGAGACGVGVGGSGAGSTSPAACLKGMVELLAAWLSVGGSRGAATGGDAGPGAGEAVAEAGRGGSGHNGEPSGDAAGGRLGVRGVRGRAGWWGASGRGSPMVGALRDRARRVLAAAVRAGLASGAQGGEVGAGVAASGAVEAMGAAGVVAGAGSWAVGGVAEAEEGSWLGQQGEEGGGGGEGDACAEAELQEAQQVLEECLAQCVGGGALGAGRGDWGGGHGGGGGGRSAWR